MGLFGLLLTAVRPARQRGVLCATFVSLLSLCSSAFAGDTASLDVLGYSPDGKVFAFLGHDGGLIVKLPEDRARLLVDEGTAERVTMGTRSMREWVAFPAQADEAATLALWQRMARQARTYVDSLGDAG